MYEDGTPGEVFISMAKEGSTISGLMDSFATAISYALQYGVPLRSFVDRMSHIAVRAERMDGESDSAVREVDHGLYLPLAGREVPGSRVRGGRSGGRSEIARDGRRSAAAPIIFVVSDGRAGMFRMRWPDDAQRVMLQVRKLRGNERV